MIRPESWSYLKFKLNSVKHLIKLNTRVVLVGNKTNITSKTPEFKQKVEEFVNRNQLYHFDTSTASGDNVMNFFQWIFRHSISFTALDPIKKVNIAQDHQEDSPDYFYCFNCFTPLYAEKDLIEYEKKKSIVFKQSLRHRVDEGPLDIVFHVHPLSCKHCFCILGSKMHHSDGYETMIHKIHAHTLRLTKGHDFLRLVYEWNLQSLENTFSDFKIVIAQQKWSLHSWILSKRCQKLLFMDENDLEFFKHLSLHTARNIISWIYTGDLDWINTDYEIWMELAHVFDKLEKLNPLNHCISRLNRFFKNMPIEKFIDTLNSSHTIHVYKIHELLSYHWLLLKADIDISSLDPFFSHQEEISPYLPCYEVVNKEELSILPLVQDAQDHNIIPWENTWKKDMSLFISEKTYLDISFQCQDGHVHSNKSLISLKCPYLQRYIENEFVVLDSISAQALNYLLDYYHMDNSIPGPLSYALAFELYRFIKYQYAKLGNIKELYEHCRQIIYHEAPEEDQLVELFNTLAKLSTEEYDIFERVGQILKAKNMDLQFLTSESRIKLLRHVNTKP